LFSLPDSFRKDRFKEAEEMKMEITDCRCENMLECFSCCDPGKLKPVDGMHLFTDVKI